MFEVSAAQLNIVIAYLAGFASFFASCLLPLIPVYLAYLAGVALQPQKHARDKKNEATKSADTSKVADEFPERTSNKTAHRRWRLIEASVLFSLGFSIAFMLMGWSIATLSTALGQWRSVFNIVVGLLFVVFGLHLTGLLKLNMLNRQWHLSLGHSLEKHRRLTAIIAGLGFGIGWTPCIGPILALILYQAAHAGSQIQGVILLAAFSIGLATPFVITGFFFELLVPWLKKTARFAHYLEIASGVLLVITGLLIATNQLHLMATFIAKFIFGTTLTI